MVAVCGSLRCALRFHFAIRCVTITTVGVEIQRDLYDIYYLRQAVGIENRQGPGGFVKVPLANFLRWSGTLRPSLYKLRP